MKAHTNDTFTVVLDTEPTGNVVFDLTSANTAEMTVSPASLTFLTGNWNAAQTVTVTGVDDADDDDDQTVSVSVAINTGSKAADSFYDAVGNGQSSM